MHACPLVRVCFSQKQARSPRKTVPWWGVYYSSSVIPLEHLVCCPFGLIIVPETTWQPFCLLSSHSRKRRNKEGRGRSLLPRYGNFPRDIFLVGRWKEGGKVGDVSFQSCQRHKPTKLGCSFHKCLISFVILWLRLNKCESFEELFTGSKVIASTSVFPII